MKRRDFLKAVGASSGLMSIPGCTTRPKRSPAGAKVKKKSLNKQRAVIQAENAGGGEKTAMSRGEILQQVQEILVDALNVDKSEVTPKASLFRDLGAESIDLLDILFRLEKAFGIVIPREELFPLSLPWDLMNVPEFVRNGKLTEKGLAELRDEVRHIDLTAFEKDPDINKLDDYLFTVDAIVNYVEGRLKKADRDSDVSQVDSYLCFMTASMMRV